MRRPAALLLAAIATAAILPGSANGAASHHGVTSVIVVDDAGTAAAARAVERIDGRVTSRIDLIGGVVARIDSDDIARLDDLAGVSVTPDSSFSVQDSGYSGTTQSTYPQSVGATDLWTQSISGEGVGVALLDTGVAAHPDLEGRVVASADLTAEGSFSDSHGHGTFLAGLIAGDGTASAGRFTGVAPDAHLVSIKVAGSDGATTLGQILYGLQLIDSAKERYNIRVVTIALAGPAVSGPDPLVLAVERLWADGLVVVAAAGNTGPVGGSIASPAVDPYIVTVGSTDEQGTPATSDDTVPEWSARGPSVYSLAKPDVVAPGKSLVSLRAAGSTADVENPTARVEDHYFLGSGTSMSAAVTAGAVALMLESDPGLTPDEVKGRLMASAASVAENDPHATGAGAVDAAAASTSDAAAANQDLPSLGARAATGAPDDPTRKARGSSFAWARNPMTGEDFWLARKWANEELAARKWADKEWAARRWAGADWSGEDWAARKWAGKDWAARKWAGEMWADADWSARKWAGIDWAGAVWATVGWR
jgi:serine protease AprX